MANKLRRLFIPAVESIEQIRAIYDEAYNEAIKNKRCLACKYFLYDFDPLGLIARDGDCKKGHAAFFGDNPDGICIDWEEE